MPAAGVISLYSKLHDVSFVRTDASPPQQGDVPVYETSASKLYMGPGGTGTGGTAQFSLGVSTGGNTLGLTGITGTRIVLAGGGEITLSQSTDGNGATITASAPPQSVQTQNLFNLTLAGNTAGVLAEVSSGTVTLAGGPNITVSQNGNAITISGAAGGGTQTAISGLANSETTYTSGTVRLSELGNLTIRSTTGQAFQLSVAPQSVQPETQTFVAGVGNSQTTYTSGTVRLSELGAVTIRSTTGQQLQISVNAQSVQPETQTFVGGVAASNTTYTSGTITIVGSGDITVLSGTGQRVIVSGSQSVQPETQTFLAGLAASDTTYSSGTVRITGVGGGVTVSSNTGQRIDISVAAPVAQTVQTQNMVAVTLSGNTSGAQALISSGTLTLAGGNNITVSQAGNAVTISGPNVGGAQTGISGLANSQTTYTSGTVSLSELGAITIRSTTGNQFQLSVNAQSVQPETQTFIGGLAASNTTYTSGTVTITGVGGGITVSSNTGQRIDLSVAAPVAQTNQAGSLFAVGNTTSSSSGTYDARTLSLRGDGMISIAATNSGFRISATQSNQAGSVFAVGNTTSSSSGTYDARTLSLRGDGIISIAATNSGFRISATESVQTQNLHNVTLSGNTAGVMAQISSGTMTLAGGNNITVSQNGNAVTISGANIGGAQTGISGIANSETTYTSGTVSLSELGAITIRSTTGQQFQLSVNSQTNQTLGLFALGNTTGESSSTTRDARTLSFRGDGIVSLGYSNGSIRISATQSVQPETQTFVAGLAASNTTYTSGTITITGVGGGVTVSSNTGQRVDISVAAPVAQTNQSLGMYALGNTTGESSSTTFDARSFSARGDGIISLGYSNGSLRISASQSVQAETQTFVGGLANSQTTYTSGTVSLSELGAITIRSTTGNQFQLSVNAQSVQTQGQMSAGVSTGGNTAGDTGVTGTRLVFVGSNNVTLSQATAAAGGTITISGPTTVAQTNQAGSIYAIGNTTSSSSGTYDARTLSISGAGIISIAATNSGWKISATQSVQPETQTFLGGLAASNTTYTSGTVTITGVGGGITVSSNTGQRIDLSVAAQTNQAGSLFAVGNTTSSSSGTYDARTLSLRGDGIISIAATNSGFRISANAQTGISGVANSQTTYTSGTVSLSELGAITIRSTTGNQFQLSVNAQTNQAGSLYAIGNTTSSSSGTYDARTISISGAGIISVAATNSGWKISATQSVQPETQTFIGGLANSQTTYTSGTVSLSELGAITIRSTTGNQYQLSVNAQTVQTQNLHNVTLSGNTAGVMAQISSGTMTLAGGNGITLSQNGNAVTISGGAGGAAFSGGVSNIGNTAGDTGVSGTRMVLAGINNITLSQSTNANGNTISISGPTQTNQTLGMYAVENTTAQSSSTTMDARTISVAGDGGASVGYSAGSLRISAPPVSVISAVAPLSTSTNGSTISILGPAQFSGGFSTQGNTLGDTGFVTGRVAFVGGNNITLSGSTNAGSQTITVVGPSLSGGDSDVTAINQTGHSLAVGDWVRLSGTSYVKAQADSEANAEVVGVVSAVADADNFTLTTGGLVTGLSGLTAGAVYYLDPDTAGAITSTEPTTTGDISKPVFIARTTTSGYVFNMRGNVVPASAITAFLAGMSNIGNTVGDTGITGSRMVLAGGNNITLSQSTNASGGTVTISAFTQSVQPGVQHLVVSNTTFSSGTVSLSGFGDVTVNTAANLIRISAPVQTAQTGISGVANSQTTYTSGTVSLSELGAITIRSTTGNQYQLSVNSQTLQTSNVHNVTLSGNTAGAMAQISSGTMTLAGGNNITLSQAGNAVTISGGAGGAFSAGLSNLGNTQGQTGVTGSRLVIVGTNNITLSQATDANGGTISISGQSPAGGAFSGGVSTGGNTAGATGISGTQMVLVGSGVMSLSQTTGANGNTVSILAPATSAISAVAPLSTSTNGSTISILAPATSSMIGVSGVSISTNGSTISIMQTTGSAFLTSLAPYDESPIVTGHQGLGSLHLSPLRIPENLQFDRMGLGMLISQATNSSGTLTVSNVVGIYTQNVNTMSLLMSTSITTQFTGSGTAGSYSLYGGPRWHTIPWTTTLTEGDYFIGIINRTATGGVAHIVNQLQLSKFTNTNWSGIVGVSTASSNQRNLGQGHYSATTGTMPASIAFTQVRGTDSIVLRTPIFMFRSGTV